MVNNLITGEIDQTACTEKDVNISTIHSPEFSENPSSFFNNRIFQNTNSLNINLHYISIL